MTGELEQEAIKILAERQLAVVSDAKGRLLDEHAASFRWLLASFFAANGGALVALSSNEQIPALAKLCACGLFTAGILFSLLAARLNQRMIQKTIEPLAKLVGFWGAVASGADFDEELFNQIGEETQKPIKATWPIQVSGWLSVAMFLLGMLAAGVGFWLHAAETHPIAAETTQAKT